jgi:hypothetical protein
LPTAYRTGSSPRLRISRITPSATFSTFALYAPARPRSDVSTSTPAFVGCSRSSSSGCWTAPLWRARSSIALVSWIAYGRDASTRCCAFTIREDAISSIARVIFFVDWTVRIRRRTMRS